MNHPVIDWFVPASIQDSGSFEELRVRVFLVGIFGLAGSVLFFAAINAFVVGLPMRGLGMVGGTMMAISAALVLRMTGSIAPAGHWIAATILGTSFWLAVSGGGVVGPSMPWLILLPIFAMLFAGVRAAIGWGITGVLAVGAMFFLHSQGVLTEQRLDEEQFVVVWTLSTAMLIGLVFVFFLLNHRLQTWLTGQLQERSAQLKTILDTAPNGIISIDEQGDIRGANRAAEMIFDRDEDQLLGESVSTFIPTLGEGSGVRHLSTAVVGQANTVNANRHTGLRGNGEEFPVAVSVGTFAGPPTKRAVMMVRDDTEMRQMRAKMMQMDRMSAVGTLAAGVGHEINNPLSYIKGNLQYLHRLLEPAVSEESPAKLDAEEMVDAVKDGLHGLQRIETIVDDLRSFSLKRDDEDFRAVDVEETLESALSIAGNEIRHRAKLQRDYDEVPAVLGNPEGLGQVLLNLILNAAEAIPEGGAEDNTIAVSTEVDGDHVVISVSDTGHGISEEDRDRIFDPFFTTREPDEGTGLGLSISQKIINEMGGLISVDSQVDRGSTFSVRLPVAPIANRQERNSPVPMSQPTSNDVQILIVDDDAKVCRALERTLGTAFDAACNINAAEAIERLRQGEDFDVIIVDLLMPDVTGQEFFETVQQFRPELARRVVIMSGGAFTPESKKFLETRDLPYLQKPVDPAQLFEMIEEILEAR